MFCETYHPPLEKMYKVEDIKDTADAGNDDEKIAVSGVRFIKYIGQDDKYIYSVIAVKLDNTYVLNGNTKQNDEGTYH